MEWDLEKRYGISKSDIGYGGVYGICSGLCDEVRPNISGPHGP